MPRLLSGRRIELAALIVALTLTTLVSSARQLRAAEGMPLQLEVILNQVPTNLVGSFIELPGHRIGARPEELAELGIKVPARTTGEEAIVLDEIAGMTYRYDEPTQKIFIQAADELLVTKVYDVRGKPPPAPPARADFGAVMNYALFASSMSSFPRSAFRFSGANVSIDARVFGPYGTLSQSAILGSTLTQEASALRLDTTWSYSDPESLRTYRIGDVISGGLAWTRPIRVGGAQLQRNFSLRPDLVTMPLPAVSGSAAVPSALDVYVNNLKVHTQEIPPGPYQLTNIPVVTGAGEASVVLRDATAVVVAGAPGVDVLYENRPAGQTDARGQLLIPGLRSYQRNTISIDPRGLPVDADAPVTQSVVAPADRSGVVVGFGVKTDVAAAVVILAGRDGKFIAPGSEGRLEGAEETFVVGYDGRAYVEGLGATNTVVVTAPTGECRATFPFAAKDNTQVVVGPLVCQ